MFGLMEQFEDGSIEGEGAAKVENAFGVLWDYVLTHFRREEDLMDAHDYPDAENHKAHHQALKEGLEDLRSRYDKEDPTVLSDLAPFIRAWLRYHILEQDMAYKAYFEERLSDAERDQIN